jgi:hypothetical protein
MKTFIPKVLVSCAVTVMVATSAASAHPVDAVALQTINGHFVTAVNGGGPPPEPNCRAGRVALHQDATQIGPWERFTMVHVAGSGRWALQTSGGQFVTAVNGGGIGGPNGAASASQVHTDALTVGPWEIFRIVNLVGNVVALRTPDQLHYLTAVNGGGCGGRNTVPFHTNAVAIGLWEQFRFIPEPPRRRVPVNIIPPAGHN